MSNIITRNLKHKTIAAIAAAAVFGGLYLLSMTLLNRVYLFEWTARNLYCYVWAAVAVLIVLDKLTVAYAVTLGNLAGVIIGQLLGDFIVSERAKLITHDTSAEMAYLLSSHDGTMIWGIVLVFFTAAGFAAQIILKKRGKNA